MKSDFLKKIIAVTVISTTMGSFLSTSASAIDFSTWQTMNGQSSGNWKQYNGKWYFYNYSGILQTGWINDKGQWYYTDANGVMQTGVIQVNGNTYLLAENGAMQTGKVFLNGTYYNFDENSGVAIGSNIPVPEKAYNTSGESTMAYTNNQVAEDDDSSPSDPNTVARDPQNLTKYNVIFRDDDGDYLRTKSIEKGEKIDLYTPTKSGYEFVEWNTKEDGDGKEYDAEDSITVNKDITLYAQWDEEDSDSTSSSDDVLVEEIVISSDSSKISTAAGTLQMSAEVLPIDASETGVTWSVEAGTGKATISDSGLLTASANGTVIVVATAKDSSGVTGRYNITISGQSSSDSGSSGGDSGGDSSTTTGGTITAFDSNAQLTDVVLSQDQNIVDLALLKASGKLPTTATVACSLSDGTVENVEIPISSWSGTFDGTQVGTYVLTATLGSLPTGYTTSATLPKPTIDVVVQTAQTDGRTPITGVAQIDTINLTSDKHIMNTALLNSSGILPSTVTLNYAGGTVTADVESWSCTNADSSAFDGSTGTKNLVAEIDVPAGYVLPSTITATATLNVTVKQTANIDSLVAVVDDTGFIFSYALNDTLDLSNLVVKVKYNDGTYGNISYSDFSDNSITTPGYFQGYPLTSLSDGFTIPVTYNGKSVYTDKITVSQAVSPTVTTSSSVVYDGSKSSNDDATFSYTLGTGTKKASGIQSVTLNGVSWTLNDQYTIDTTNKLIKINADALKDYYENVVNSTPSTYVLNVVFTPVSGTTTLKPASNPTIHFISTPDAPSGITLATSGITAKDNTIRLLGLESSVQYEYCVVTTGGSASWTSAKSFTATTTYKELTDTNFVAGNELYIRKKSTTDGSGATNPASSALGPITILSENIGRTLSTTKAITAFSVNYAGTDYAGTITEGSSSGTIKVIVPTVMTEDSNGKVTSSVEMPVTNLTASYTTTGKSINGPFTDFTNSVTYIVTAEDGSTRNYVVTVLRTQPQATVVRSDTFTYTTSTVDANNVTTTTSASVNILTDGYEKSGLVINSIKDGIVKITVPESSSFTDDQKKALEYIRKLTASTNPQIAYVGMKFTPETSTTPTKVKIATSLEGLKTASSVTLGSSNMLSGEYFEAIPAVAYDGSSWSKIESNTIKYYQWIDSKGNILGYTSLNIIVE